MSSQTTALLVNFDANGNPIDVVMTEIETDQTGNVDAQSITYALVAADVTAINSVITNARASVGNF